MSKDFRHARFGLVPADLPDGRMSACELILKSFLSSTGTNSLMNNCESHREVFTICREYIGDDFKNWLYVNFWSGNGARKELARKIVAYINGTVSVKAITTQIRMDILRLGVTASSAPLSVPILYDEYDPVRNKWKVEDVDFSVVEDRHFYDFIALMGPEMTAGFVLSLNGVQYV